jgi:prophage DNA circulation protein
MADIKVRKNISLTSPSGDRFIALWDGGNRTVKKRLAMYAYAGINGQVVDDYGCDSITYPITLIFNGEEHRKDAKDFFRAFQEKGKWTVTHPTDGLMGLQGVQATENDQPVKQANMTRIETEWIEYIDPITLKTLRNSMLEMGIVTQQLEDETTIMAEDQMELDAAGTLETKNSLKNVIDSVKAAYNRAQYAAQAAADRQTEFLDYITQATVLAAGVVSQIQNIINAPARALKDLRARLNVLKNIIDDLFGSDNDPVEPNKNDAIVREVTAAAVVSTVAAGVINASEDEESGLGSRVALLESIAAFDQLVETIETGVDRIKKQFDEKEATTI